MHCIQYLFIRCSLWPREDETGVLHAALTSFLDRIGPVLLPYATHGTIEVCSCSYSIRDLPPTLTRSIGYMIAIVLHIYCVSPCALHCAVASQVCAAESAFGERVGAAAGGARAAHRLRARGRLGVNAHALAAAFVAALPAVDSLRSRRCALVLRSAVLFFSVLSASSIRLFAAITRITSRLDSTQPLFSVTLGAIHFSSVDFNFDAHCTLLCTLRHCFTPIVAWASAPLGNWL